MQVLFLLLDGPRNLAITPFQISYRLGDKLTCSADANPTPMYEWKDNITAFTTLTKGPHYTIPSFVTPFAVECRASNPIGSDSRSVPINLSSGKLSLKMHVSNYNITFVFVFY